MWLHHQKNSKELQDQSQSIPGPWKPPGPCYLDAGHAFLNWYDGVGGVVGQCWLHCQKNSGAPQDYFHSISGPWKPPGPCYLGAGHAFPNWYDGVGGVGDQCWLHYQKNSGAPPDYFHSVSGPWKPPGPCYIVTGHVFLNWYYGVRGMGCQCWLHCRKKFWSTSGPLRPIFRTFNAPRTILPSSWTFPSLEHIFHIPHLFLVVIIKWKNAIPLFWSKSVRLDLNCLGSLRFA